MTRPAPVRIDDFADPVFPPAIAGIRAQMAELAPTLDLSVGKLADAARAQTGLTDLGDDWWEEPFGVLLDCIAGLSPVGIVSNSFFLTALLKNRLLIQDVITRHPELLDTPVEAPIVICGLPRTGTTHLHNLMAADPTLRHLPYWESLEPVPAPGEAGVNPDPRLERTAAALDMVNTAMPLFVRMHEMTVDHAHEEIQLLAIAGSTMLFETIAPMPGWLEWYSSHDQRPAYRYLYRALQVLQHLRGPRRWVLKSPQHIEQFGPLVETFPDATFVVTHREPVAVTTSMITMLTYTARMAVDHPSPDHYGAYWAPRLEAMLRACVRDHALLPAARTIDVRFDEFMADDVAMVRRIYELARHPFGPATEAAMGAFMDAHPRGRFGGIEYDLAAFGLSVAERRGALAFYSDRFGLPTE